MREVVSLMAICTTGCSLYPPTRSGLFGLPSQSCLAAMHTPLHLLIDKLMACCTGRGDVGRMQRRLPIGCWMDAVAAMAIRANSRDDQT